MRLASPQGPRGAMSPMMKSSLTVLRGAITACILASCGASPRDAATPPPAVSPAQAAAPVAALVSWNDGAARNAIIDFVGRTTKVGGADFVKPAERIAV